jgi:hypothetical protein
VRPHPHIGLATVTYLIRGEIIHRDSLGTLQSEKVDHAIGEVSFEDQGRSRVINRNRGLLRVYARSWQGVVPRSRDGRPGA